MGPPTIRSGDEAQDRADGAGETPRITELSTWTIVRRVALPATASFMLNTCFNLIDAYFVGQLGTDAMASLSSASIVTWMLYSLGSLGQVGGQAFVSQAIGARDAVLERRAVLAALALHAVTAVLVLTPLFFLCGRIFEAMHLAPAVALGAQSYLRPFAAGMLVYLPGMVAMAAFHARGDTRTPALVLAAALSVNALLDPLLIFGAGPIPALGLYGAGLATAFCKVLFSLSLVVILHRRGILDFTFWKADRAMGALIRKIAAVGFPIAVNGMFFSGVYLALVRIISGFGTVPVATLGIVHRIENLGWFACTGFSVAGAALAGQLMGAGRRDEARRKVWRLTLCLSGILLLVSAVYVLFGGAMVSVFTEDSAVVAEGIRYLTIIAIFEALMGWETMFEEALGAVGTPGPALAVSTPLTLLRIPASWLFAVHLDFGVSAVWWVISASTALKGLSLALCFSFGRWRKKAGSLAG